MVEGSVGVLRRTDSHDGEVKLADGVGGDRSGNRILLPILVGFGDKDSSCDKTKTDNDKPNNLR